MTTRHRAQNVSATAGARARQQQRPRLAEANFQQRIVDLALLYGCLVFHDTDARRDVAGFPDLVIVGRFVLFVELKADDGRVSADQQTWLNALLVAGSRAAVWRPRDWDEARRILAEIRTTRGPTR